MTFTADRAILVGRCNRSPPAPTIPEPRTNTMAKPAIPRANIRAGDPVVGAWMMAVGPMLGLMRVGSHDRLSSRRCSIAVLPASWPHGWAIRRRRLRAQRPRGAASRSAPSAPLPRATPGYRAASDEGVLVAVQIEPAARNVADYRRPAS